VDRVYAAKRLGIKTGTLYKDAKKLCPNVIPVRARHALYTDYHDRILKTVDTCIPIEKIVSIDEVACRLMGREREIPAAREIAHKIKRALREQIGECITCSIGLASNVFLGKVGSDLQKPDGLVVLTPENLPDAILHLRLRDIYGIGRRMEERLNRAGIRSVADLWNAPSHRLRQIWGGIHGLLYYQMLHGVDIQPPSSSRTKSMSHQHVLEPELRNRAGAKNFSHHLLTKAAERLRHKNYFCHRLGLHLSWLGDQASWWDEVDFHEARDTDFLLERLEHLWRRVPNYKPLTVSVVLMGLVPASGHQPDLFADNPRRHKLSSLVDNINDRYGRGAIGFGLMPSKVREFRGHAAFQRVPEAWEF